MNIFAQLIVDVSNHRDNRVQINYSMANNETIDESDDRAVSKLYVFLTFSFFG